MEAVNSCRFIGNLIQYSIKESIDGLIIGKGTLLLPDSSNPDIGQPINILAWGDIALKLSEINPADWITLLTAYTPSIFRGNIQDTFTVGSFKKLWIEEKH